MVGDGIINVTLLDRECAGCGCYCLLTFFIYLHLLKTGLGILDFYHSDWLNGARLSAHIPAVTKYGQ